MRHVGSLFPNQGLNPCPLQWKRQVLTVGLPGKSLGYFFFLMLATFVFIVFLFYCFIACIFEHSLYM